MNITPIIKTLLIVNIAVFIIDELSGNILSAIGGLYYYKNLSFHLWQIITYMFLHGGLAHLFFNMLALWMFGRVMEQTWGANKLLIYYMICGVGAGLVQELAQYIHYLTLLPELPPVPHEQLAEALNAWNTVGASGAVYGILLAFGMLFPDERMFIIPIPVPIKAKYFVVGYAVIELMSALLRSNDQVAHMAHLGGMLFGLFLLLHWRKPGKMQRKIKSWWSKVKGPENRTFHYQRNTEFDEDIDYNARKQARQEEVDRILDKVKKRGYGSLTEEEKRKLFNAGE